jgi:hypothetical protein
LFSGYLTALSAEYREGVWNCRLQIPNLEITDLYRRLIREWFTDVLAGSGYRNFLKYLVAGDVRDFTRMLRGYLLKTASVFDVQHGHPESFYHGLVLGMLTGLDRTHIIRSNRESGFGRYDVALFPKAEVGGARKSRLGILMEFKRVSKATQLESAAKKALAQIDERRYETDLREYPVKRILAIGMAFSGKRVAVAHRMSELAT